MTGLPNITEEEIEANRISTGAHEVGHILGLDDVDVCCAPSDENQQDKEDYHHEELLMGYAKGDKIIPRQQNITYKDLAGVAITRGFHTDNDHRWLRDTSQMYDEKHKLICSICNGVKYVTSLSGYTYYNYGRCNDNHTLSSDNMMAVGCNGNKDYIKCKFCRYVALVEDMVTQNCSYQSIDLVKHRITNNVNGLDYTLEEEHTFTYRKINDTYHKTTCECGYDENHRHSMTEEDYTDGDNIGRCIQCKSFFNINNGMFPILPTQITKYSINGSYILPNGIVVLVNKDIPSYLNNTLIFYDKNNLPQIS